MEFTNRLSTAQNFDEIIRDLTKDTKGPYDLGILFLAQQDYGDIKNISEHYRELFGVKNIVGCTCAGIIGSHNEVEHKPGASLILAKLPQVKITPFAINHVPLQHFNHKK